MVGPKDNENKNNVNNTFIQMKSLQTQSLDKNTPIWNSNV